MVEVLLLVSLSVAGPQPAPQDPRDAAERAAFTYESLLSRRARIHRGGGGGPHCDETIGRFCFTFTDDEPDLPDRRPDHPEIVQARDRAISAHRAWLSQDPAGRAAGPLVRYLVEADRQDEAVAVARTHAWAADRTPSSLLLLGLALHEAGRIPAAESVFDSARGSLPAAERLRLDDVEALLEPEEGRAYARLGAQEKEAYEARLWRFSDPSTLDPGNERRSAHYARHAWAAILAQAPLASGRLPWGDDSAEVLLRYGRPVARERMALPAVQSTGEPSIVEVFDPRSVSLVPGALRSAGIPSTPEPVSRPSSGGEVVRSSYAPVGGGTLRELSVQAARFPHPGGAMLLVSGRLSPDSAGLGGAADDSASSPSDAVGGRLRGQLAIQDTAGHVVARVPATVWVDPDGGIRAVAEALVEPGTWAYHLDVRNADGRHGFARYATEIVEAEGLRISDLLLAAPEERVPEFRAALTPAASLELAVGGRVLVWAEVTGPVRREGEASLEVEWWVESAEEGTAVGRVARWLGRRLGLVGPERASRIRWSDRSWASPVPVGFVIDLEGQDPGLYRIGLTARDLPGSREVTSTRVVWIGPEGLEARPRGGR